MFSWTAAWTERAEIPSLESLGKVVMPSARAKELPSITDALPYETSSRHESTKSAANVSIDNGDTP